MCGPKVAPIVCMCCFSVFFVVFLVPLDEGIIGVASCVVFFGCCYDCLTIAGFHRGMLLHMFLLSNTSMSLQFKKWPIFQL